MKTTALAIALLMSGAAIAQTTTYTTTTTQPELDVDADVDIQPDGDLDIDADVDVDKEVVTTTHTMATYETMAHSVKMAASNANPERDARGIVVISDPAIVPSGWNGIPSTGMGGPAEGEDKYPACTAKITDNCIQTYEVGNRR